jgi:uncharacterized repeat protein (TIGR03803 family)
MIILNWMTKACGVFLLWAMAAVALPTQTLLHSFDLTDGYLPDAALIQGTDGNLYGTTVNGGANSNSSCTYGCGTVFKISPGGTLTTIYNLCSQSNCTDGFTPFAGLVQGTDGNYYGTTYFGGANSCPNIGTCGTVFKITPGGVLTTLHSFDGIDGSGPQATLVQATDGIFYGTTPHGGASNNGTVFTITPSGRLATIHKFDGTDGSFPSELIQGTDGNFYGTTNRDGANGEFGTAFTITPSGMLTTLHSFDRTDGIAPYAGLVQGTDGNFYGTTAEGGSSANCSNLGCGTVFTMTRSGTVTTLHSFDSTDGAHPYAGLAQGTDGNVYGATGYGGSNGYGTIFIITPSGTFATLGIFNVADGESPFAGLVQDTNGIFYGTTTAGGAQGYGTIFSLSVSLKPFVETEPTSGAVGTTVNILGTNLTGATGVTFNGTPAVFTVASKTLITTTVPAGATTGTVQVVTPNGKGLSNLPFTVLP